MGLIGFNIATDVRKENVVDVEDVMRSGWGVVEAASFFVNVVRQGTTNDGARAEGLVGHLNAEACRLPQMIIESWANSVVAQVETMLSATPHGVYLVLEGTYSPKSNGPEGKRRAAARAIALRARIFSKAVTVPDCLVRLALSKIAGNPRIIPVFSPAEGEAQVCIFKPTSRNAYVCTHSRSHARRSWPVSLGRIFQGGPPLNML